MSTEPVFPPPVLVPLAKRIFDLLRKRGEKVCIVETACGGLISATLLALPGASAIFAGSQNLYTLGSRVTMSDWTPAHIKEYEGPTPAIVEGLCASLRTRLTVDPFSGTEPDAGADLPQPRSSDARQDRGPGPPAATRRVEDPKRLWAVGESGTAGPGRSGEGRNRTPGYVALAVVAPSGVSIGVEEMMGTSDRVDNMVSFARAGLGLLLQQIEAVEANEKAKGSVM